MSHELDIKDKLKFDDIDLISPDVVITEIGNQLEEITKGFVKGVVSNYEGPIESYNSLSGIASIAAALGTLQDHDIQEDLGEIGYEVFRFEFYLTATMLPNYKFRVMFFEYGLGGYPVKIVLEQGVADEIFKEAHANYIFEKQTKSELENTINNILASKRIIKVVQGLINESLKTKGQGQKQLPSLEISKRSDK